MRFVGEQRIFHIYAVWQDWAFDHSGWNREPVLLAVNAEFESRPVERIEITVDLVEFCEMFHHRMPHQYWRDPIERAREYTARFAPPWT